MSDEIPSLADLLNDNPGLVGAAAGVAVSRGVQNTNKSIEQLRREITEVKRQLEREHANEELERQLRNQVFRIAEETDGIAAVGPSPETMLRIKSLLAEFNKLGLTSASFTSLQDKEFVKATKERINRVHHEIVTGVAPEVLNEINVLSQWYNFTKSVESFLQNAEAIESNTLAISSAMAAREDARKARYAQAMHNPKIIALMSCTALFLVVGVISLALVDSPQSVWAPVAITSICLTVLPGALLAIELSDANRSRLKKIQVAEEAVSEMQKQSSRLISIGNSLESALRSAVGIPHDLPRFFSDASRPLREKKDKASELKAYVGSLRHSLGVSTESLAKLF